MYPTSLFLPDRIGASEVMKYFKKELWSELNSKISTKRFETISEIWDKNSRNYWKYIKRISHRLPRSVRLFVNNVELHDGLIYSISFENDKQKKNKILFSLSCPEDGNEYVLTYQKIRKCIFDYPSLQPLFTEKDNCEYGSWAYDEFGITKDEWLKHTILLDTGATLYIECKTFSFTKNNVSKAVFPVKPKSKNVQLHYAVMYNELSEVKKLLTKKNVNSTFRGYSPLHWAAQQGFIKMTDILIKKGANLEKKDDCGFTPLFKAVGENHVKTVKLLIDKGANVNALDETQGTPLMIACSYDRVIIADLLIKAGADTSIRDKDRNCAIDYAKKGKHLKVIKVIESTKNR